MYLKKEEAIEKKVRTLYDFNKKVKITFNGTIYKLYEKGSILIGQLIVSNDTILWFVINPKFRLKGFGKKLLSIAEKDISKKFNHSRLIPQDNDESLRYFYSKLGYVGFNGTEDGYEEEDKSWWVMTKKLH